MLVAYPRKSLNSLLKSQRVHFWPGCNDCRERLVHVLHKLQIKYNIREKHSNQREYHFEPFNTLLRLFKQANNTLNRLFRNIWFDGFAGIFPPFIRDFQSPQKPFKIQFFPQFLFLCGMDASEDFFQWRIHVWESEEFAWTVAFGFRSRSLHM